MVQFSQDDVKDPHLLELLLRQMQAAIDSGSIVGGTSMDSQKLQTLARQLAPLIRRELQSPGSAPLNLQSLLPFSNFAAASTTITLAKITPGGTNGSLVFNSSGIITSAVAPT